MERTGSAAVVRIIEHPQAQAEGLGHKAQEHNTLYRLTDRLYRARGLEQVYAASLDAICESLGCSRASILRFDAAGVMRFVAWRGLSDTYRQAVEGHSAWQAGDGNAEAVFIEDILRSGEPEALKKTLLSENIRALAFIPLEIEDRVVGKFMLYYDDPRVFSDHERELSLIIARQLGFAVDRSLVEGAARRLAALVESSNDAIIAKDLDGIITDWNGGAERLFGYSTQEVIGKSVTILIPPDRQDEEPTILGRIRTGERVEHFETVRRRKDGSLVDISLTISPIRNGSGRVVGASKIARDISERRRAQEQQQLLLKEMNHRVKNLFALAGGIVTLNAKTAPTAAALAATVSDQLTALSRAHALTMSPTSLDNGEVQQGTTLHALIEAILTPYAGRTSAARPRFSISGHDIPISVAAVTPVALLFHEFATNAAKYGSLSAEGGTVDVTCRKTDEGISIVWQEAGGPRVGVSGIEGFGSRLINATASQVGRISRSWHPDGVVIELVLAHRFIDPLAGARTP
jgi:PAS domain S-box-containing protein